MKTILLRFISWLSGLFRGRNPTPTLEAPQAPDKHYQYKLLKKAAKYRRRREAWNRNQEGQKRKGSQAVLRARREAGRLQELADGILSQQRTEQSA